MIGLNVDRDNPLYQQEEESIDNLFKNCDMVKSLWLNIEVNYTNLITLAFLY